MDQFFIQLIDEYLKKHSWVVFVFIVSSIIVNTVRYFFPVEKKRPKWLNATLYIIDIGAVNFWGLARFAGLKLKLPITVRKRKPVKRKSKKKKTADVLAIKNKDTPHV